MIDRTAAVEVRGAPLSTRAGDTFNLGGIEWVVGETEWKSGMGRVVVAWLIPPLMAVLYHLRFRGRVEGRERHLTSEQLPCHDPPVAWHVSDHPYANIGIPVIACPGVSEGSVKVLAPGGYMDPAPVVLDGEPGRRP